MTSLEIKIDGNRVALSGELDIATVPDLERELNGVEAKRPEVLIVDLREVSFIDSTGLRLLVGADARAREQGRRVVIVRGPEAVERILTVTGLGERFEIIDDPEAIEAKTEI